MNNTFRLLSVITLLLQLESSSAWSIGSYRKRFTSPNVPASPIQAQLESTGKEVTTRLSEIIPPVPRPRFPARPTTPREESGSSSLKKAGPGLLGQATASALSLAASFLPADEGKESPKAVKVNINSLPPTSIALDLRGIPIFGGLLSGTYARVREVERPAVSVALPQKKLEAYQEIAENGRLEFDIGGLITTHLDADVASSPGEAMIQLKSQLIPKWPFDQPKRKSEWNRVTNLGTGESYYFNQKTREVQYESPELLEGTAED